MQAYYPAKRPEGADFGTPKGGEVAGGVFSPTAGYVTDPALATHNLQRAAEAHGARFRFNARITEILQESRRISDVKLADGLALHAPVVINVGGPASFLINAMAGVTDDMTMTTRALKQDVVHVRSPAGFDSERNGIVVFDSDISCYCRPEHGNHILIGSEDPPCDEHVWVTDDAD